jgi:tRNA pseudouridine38-40 synthase
MPVSLDLRGMNRAASLLTGTRDFGFLGSAPDGGHTVRTVLKACWERNPAVWGSGELQALRFTVTANAFLFRMVRRMVALTVKVGRRQLALADLCSLRDSVGGVTPGPAPANGLVLSRVTYATPISDMWKAGKA